VLQHILGWTQGLRRPETHFNTDTGSAAARNAFWSERGGGEAGGGEGSGSEGGGGEGGGGGGSGGPQWYVMPQHGGITYHYKHR